MALPDLELIYPDAQILDDLFWRAFWLVSVTFLIVLLILVYFVIRYRARTGHSAFYTHGNSTKALSLTVGLAIAVFVGIDLHLAWYDHHAFAALFENPPAQPYEVRVMAKQFEWNFRYPGKDGVFDTEDDLCTIKELVIPVNRPVMLRMQSIDVIHSLYIPNARKKQDVVPGLEVRMWFDANITTEQARQNKGNPKFDYEIACAELCGLDHTGMRARLTILTPEQLQTWLETETKKLEDFDRPPIWKNWKAQAAPAVAAATTSGEHQP